MHPDDDERPFPYYERHFFVPITQIEKFIQTLNSFNTHGDIHSFTIVYNPSANVFDATIRFKRGGDFILFHNVIVTFLTGIKTEGVL